MKQQPPRAEPSHEPSPTETAARPHRNALISEICRTSARALAKAFQERGDDGYDAFIASIVALALGNPRLNAAQIHDQWRINMTSVQGWTAGNGFDAGAKVTPAVKSFQDLDTFRRVRVGVVVAIVREVANALD